MIRKDFRDDSEERHRVHCETDETKKLAEIKKEEEAPQPLPQSKTSSEKEKQFYLPRMGRPVMFS